MKQHRYVSLTDEEVQDLKGTDQMRVHPYFKNRCFCLLLSNRGWKINELADIFEVQEASIRRWFNAWESFKLEGIYIKKGRGRKPTLPISDPEIVSLVEELITDQPLKVLTILPDISEKVCAPVSKWMVIILLQKLGYTYRRIRKSLKNKQNPAEYLSKLAELMTLRQLEQNKELTLYYGDESGFNETPCVPYGWQKKDSPILLPSTHGKRLNVFGLLTVEGELHTYVQEKGSIKSDFIIESIDDFVFNKSSKGRSIIVLDNARVHHSKVFNKNISKWEDENVFIFFLPTYSPHLNLIETLWRKCKYEWLLPVHFKSWKTLTEQLRNIFRSYGTEGSEYTIHFSST